MSRILRDVPQLASRILAALFLSEDGQKTWQPDMERVRNVIAKLARGHLDYELSIQERDDPDEIVVMPLTLISREHRQFFECSEPDIMAVWPELSSRAFMRALPSGERIADGWIDVQ